MNEFMTELLGKIRLDDEIKLVAVALILNRQATMRTDWYRQWCAQRADYVGLLADTVEEWEL